MISYNGLSSGCISLVNNKNIKQSKTLNCVDLFSGAGGFSLAAINSGFKVRLAVENNRHACNTYRLNFCDGKKNPPKLIEGDINQIDVKKLRTEIFKVNEVCDLLLGGPPCQGFSTHRINGAGIHDPRNDLIHVYFKFVKELSPSLFLMENVPGMLWPRHSAYMKKFYEEGEGSGYHIFKPVVLDARDFGVPQRRKRVFVLGVRRDIDLKDFSWPPKATHCDPSLISEDSELLPWLNCRDVFKRAPKGDINNIHMRHSEALIKVFKKTPKNGGSRRDSGRILKCHLEHDGHKDVYGRIDPREPGPTMTTACINPSKGRFVHPTQNHGITLRQAARLQAFPDSFLFQGGLIAAGQQIGNAVPVKLGQALITHLKALALSAKEVKETSVRDAA